jgi:hypothetical protein
MNAGDEELREAGGWGARLLPVHGARRDLDGVCRNDTKRPAAVEGRTSPWTPSGRSRSGRPRTPDTLRRAVDPSGDGRNGWRSRTRGSRAARRASEPAPEARIVVRRPQRREGSRGRPRSTRPMWRWPLGLPSALRVMEGEVSPRAAAERSMAHRRQPDPQSVSASRGGLPPRPSPSTASGPGRHRTKSPSARQGTAALDTGLTVEHRAPRCQTAAGRGRTEAIMPRAILIAR